MKLNQQNSFLYGAMLQASVPGNPLTPMSDQDRSLQNQILQTNIKWIVWEAVRRIERLRARTIPWFFGHFWKPLKELSIIIGFCIS